MNSTPADENHEPTYEDHHQGRLIIVEDEHIITLDLCRMLEELDYVVDSTYASAESVMRRNDLHEIDFAVVDIHLCGSIDGIELGKWLLKEYRIPSIFVTAYGDFQTLQRAKVIEPHAYLVKPIRSFELVSALEIAKYRMKAEKARIRAQQLSRRLERSLETSRKMEAVGRFAAGVAHDLNNALAAVLGHLELLRLELPKSQHHESLQLAHEGCKEACETVQDLLGFAGKGSFLSEYFDLVPLLHDVVGLLRGTIGDSLTIALPNDEGYLVTADRTKTRRVVSNLILNAHDACSPRGQLQIRVERRFICAEDIMNPGALEGWYVVASFEDDGKGISEEIMDIIFEPLFTTKGSSTGLGMGLATAYGVMNRTGGWISAHSDGSKGATFELVFPTYTLISTGPN